MTRIGVLHPGAMGAAVGGALVAAGHEVGWLAAGRSAATADRAEAAGLQRWDSVGRAEVVLSLVPPAAALETARAVAGFRGVYLDANAVSPDRAAQVAQVVRSRGGDYVDGGVVGPPPRSPGTTRLYLSGEGASGVATLFCDTVVEPVVVPGAAFSASAVKMTYAAVTKIGAALTLAAAETAAALGVADVLYEEWSRSQPHVLDRLSRAREDAATKGWRWSDEMHQIAATFAAARQPSEFGDAAAQVYAHYPRPR